MELAEALAETLAVELAEALAGATVELAKEGWPSAVTRWWPAKSYGAQ